MKMYLAIRNLLSRQLLINGLKCYYLERPYDLTNCMKELGKEEPLLLLLKSIMMAERYHS